MIHLNDIRKKAIHGDRYRTEYRASCDTCGVDRGYLTKQNATNYPNCRKCSHKNISKDTLIKMSTASKGRPAWNKGIKGISEETRLKMRLKKLGVSPANKGKNSTLEQRIKLSCINRNISIDEFDDFTTEESKRERNRFADLGLHLDCFKQHGYLCDRCGITETTLNAHHKNSWKHFPEQRFDITNLVALCWYCHTAFHKIYGNGKVSENTADQYVEFKNSYIPNIRKKVIVVAGVSGSGKSWVCNNLKNTLYYHEYDKNNRKEVRSLIWNLPHKIVLFDPFSHVSTFIKRNHDLFDIELYVIQESEDVIRDRLLARGGTFTPSIKRRIERMKNLAKNAYFTGTSSEVLEKLKLIQNHP